MNRTNRNGTLRMEHEHQQVTLIGWVAKRRNFGALVFVDLRDTTGVVQLVFDEQLSTKIVDVRNEYILQVSGIVCKRKESNPKMATGEIEIKVSDVCIVNSAKTTPLIIADETDALEEVRMKYRYLDLRRPSQQNKLKTRHHITKVMRAYLDDLDFVEIETPVLTKSTPEGARDYLVPSRVHPGEFYALPQSPQLFKQLLMISGMERYYQVARCFRDEDLRSDRQLDFTHFDIEVSFMDDHQIQSMLEGMMAKVMLDVKNITLTTPFRKMTYHDAMNMYGSDKPDDRFDLCLQDVSTIFSNSNFKVFQDCLATSGVIKAIVVNNQAGLSRKEIDKLVDLAKKYKAKGLVSLKYIDGTLEGPIVKFLSEQEQSALVDHLALQSNDLILISSDQWDIVCEVLGALRLHFAKELSLTSKDTYSFLWVTDFPLLEYNDEDQRYYAKHHPFTRPKQEDIELLDSDPSNVRAIAYDMVLNGYEIGGGSLRIYDNELQTKMFQLLGFSEQETRSRFGFFIDALTYGTPPHGGLAFGLDRVAMILTESDSLREVIAFPKNASARDSMCDAPSPVDGEQLKELHIKIRKD